DKSKRFRGLRHARENERRRDVVALAGIARGDLAAVFEGWRADRETHLGAPSRANGENVNADKEGAEQKQASAWPRHRQPLARPPTAHPGARPDRLSRYAAVSRQA